MSFKKNEVSLKFMLLYNEFFIGIYSIIVIEGLI